MTVLSNLESSCVDEINSNVAGFVSLIANITLIYTTSKVRIYSNAVRKMQYYVCILRLIFSISIVLTSPTLIYINKLQSLYIVKGGFRLPEHFGEIFLICFVTFVVVSCNSPTIQYLQVAHLLSKYGNKHNEFGPLISTMSLFVGIPAVVFITIGYLPSKDEQEISSEVLDRLTNRKDSSFLVFPIQERYNMLTKSMESDFLARLCTIYILFVMVFSVIIVIVCLIYIQRKMVQQMMSSNSYKKQRQLNLSLFVQFSLPFITIHIPFYMSFILPFFHTESSTLSNYFPYLFSWCPAINPILVIISVQNIRDNFLLISRIAKPESTVITNVRYNC